MAYVLLQWTGLKNGPELVAQGFSGESHPIYEACSAMACQHSMVDASFQMRFAYSEIELLETANYPALFYCRFRSLS